MNKDAEGRWKVGRSYIKLKMRAKGGVGVFTAFLNLGLVLVLLVSLEVYSSFYVQLIAGYYVPILAIQPRSKSE